jgi:putative transposase
LESGGIELPVSPSRRSRGERGIWQRRFWEPTALEPDDLEIRFDYTHYNPVKHGYVRRPRYWPPSTFHRYVELGHYAANWGASEPQHLQGLDFE